MAIFKLWIINIIEIFNVLYFIKFFFKRRELVGSAYKIITNALIYHYLYFELCTKHLTFYTICQCLSITVNKQICIRTYC